MIRALKRWFVRQSEPAEETPIKPRITIRGITFSDGTSLKFAQDDVVLLVGPNNAGKTAALREILQQASNVKQRTVTTTAEIEVIGRTQDLRRLLDEQAQLINYHGSPTYVGYKFDIMESYLRYFEQSDRSNIIDVFGLFMSTEDRLRASNPVESIFYPNDRPTTPIHILVTDAQLERTVSEAFSHAFGTDLMVYRPGGKLVPLLIGSRESVEETLKSFEKTDIEFVLGRTKSLHKQGDGMRAFASVLLDMVAAKLQSFLLIDEPETFLHPPQARLIGEYIAQFAGSERQVFLATHSPDVLQGALAVRGKKIRILRIQRSGNVNVVKELPSKLAREISTNILTRSSGVYQGMFHSAVVVCESDADTLFYEAILESVSSHFRARPDILFVHGAGKQRMAKLASTSRALGVPTAAIVDIDILNNKALFREISKAFDLNWDKLSADWSIVSNAIESQKVGLSLQQMASAFSALLEKLKTKAISLTDFGQSVRDILSKNAPWDNVKRAGRMGLPGGDVVAAFDRLTESCSNAGLWILGVGELEGFCKSVNSKGAVWVEYVLSQRNLADDVELTDARELLVRIRSWFEANT